MPGGDQEREEAGVEGKGQRGLGKENVGGCSPTWGGGEASMGRSWRGEKGTCGRCCLPKEEERRERQELPLEEIWVLQ